ncbi:MAG: carboxypeptidase-like regulatory domain-containing protein [Acidobacteriota bacterium]
MRRALAVALVMAVVPAVVGARPLGPSDWRQGHYCGTTSGPPLAPLSQHLFNLRQLERQGIPLELRSPGDRDIGNVAVIEATKQSGILVDINPFDLKQRSVKFKRNKDGSYAVQFVGAVFDETAGPKLDLGDDDSEPVDIGFSFKFFSKTHTRAYVNSDGNVTFEQGDDESTDRNFTRFNALVRIAPLFDDLNPQQGGEVDLAKLADRVVITWNNVPEFSESTPLPANRFQVVLYKSGDIQFNWTSSMSPTRAIVGITPGMSSGGTPDVVDYATDLPIASLKGAIGEIFSNTKAIDEFAVIRKFLASHGDSFDTVQIWTNSREVQIIPRGSGAFAYEMTLKNEVGGIGEEIYDFSSFVGSSGRFKSLVVMDYIHKYPSDPTKKFLGESSTVSVMGEETGHLWLAKPRIMENGVRTTNLLGRSLAHWSFYFDTDASCMEGNDIQDNGNGTFGTIAASMRYSGWDHYLMGFRPSSSVPDSFYVTGAGGDPSTSPKVGVTFNGTRVNVNVGQIIQAEGQRNPLWDKSQHVLNQGFVMLVKQGATPSTTDLTKFESFISAWQTFWKAGVEDRAAINVALTGGAVAGTVKDKKGTVLSAVPVTVSLKKYGIVRTVTSGTDGKYSLGLLRAGDYQLLAKRGTRQIKKSVKIVGTETATADFIF